MIGFWATDEHYVYSCKTSRRKEEGIGAHATRVVDIDNGDTIFDFIYRSKILDNCIFRPIHD